MGATNVEIQSDSQVVVGQVQGQFETQEDRMARYLDQVRHFQSYFDRVVVTKIPREANVRADELSKIASGTDEEIEASQQQVIVLTELSITPKVNIMEACTTSNEPKWVTEIIQFLKNGLLPHDKCNDPPPMTQYCPLLAPHIRLPRRSPILGLLSQRLA
jgi:hypothetical protein